MKAQVLSRITVLAAVTILFTTSPRAPAQPAWGSALWFDGTNDYVQAGDIPLANSSFTVEAWVQRRSSGTMDMVVSQGSSGYNHCLMFGFHYYAGNQFVFDFYGNGVGSGTADTDNAWHHWAGTYDAVTKVRCLCRDGVLIASNTNSAEHYQGSGPLKIGVGPGGEAPNEFDGQIDDVRVWNVARSADQIRQHLSHRLTGQESNLIGYWKFDEGAGATAHDSTTNGYDGTLYGPPAWTTSTVPPWGKALSFDGTNDYVSATIPALASNYTMSAWVFLLAGGNYPGVRMAVLSSTACGASTELLIRSHTASYTDPQYLELGRCSVFDGTPSTNTVPTNQWVHVTATVSSNKQVSYFINGIPAGSWNASGKNLTIGPSINLGDNSSRRFKGFIDDFRIWNKALSQAEIQADMWHPLTGAESSLVAYWNFDEGDGTTAFDRTTNGCNGTLFNGPQWTPSTIPGSPAPVFTVCKVDGLGQLWLQATGGAGLTYTLQTSTNLMNWVNGTVLVAGTNGLIECAVELESNVPACFYRVRWP